MVKQRIRPMEKDATTTYGETKKTTRAQDATTTSGETKTTTTSMAAVITTTTGSATTDGEGRGNDIW